LHCWITIKAFQKLPEEEGYWTALMVAIDAWYDISHDLKQFLSAPQRNMS